MCRARESWFEDSVVGHNENFWEVRIQSSFSKEAIFLQEQNGRWGTIKGFFDASHYEEEHEKNIVVRESGEIQRPTRKRETILIVHSKTHKKVRLTILEGRGSLLEKGWRGPKLMWYADISSIVVRRKECEVPVLVRDTTTMASLIKEDI